MMKNNVERNGLTMLFVMLLAATALLTGCQSDTSVMPESAIMAAHYTAVPVMVDGVLDDAIWSRASVYELSLSADRVANDDELLEAGQAQVAWDDNYLYVAVKYVDLDIVAEGEEDQLHHYQLGDLAEVFVKPADKTWYWEMYATPHNKKSTFWFPGRGYLGLPSCTEEYVGGLKTAAQCHGTLNDWRDKDAYWTAEFAVPVADLTARGESFGPGSKWKIFVARYNYGRYIPNKELSMTPMLPRTSYHIYESYADVLFVGR